VATGLTEGDRGYRSCAKNIALCRMAIEYSEIGTEAEAGNWTGTASGSRPRWSGSRSNHLDKTRPGPDLQRSYGAPPG
jgi:hypothetical protein